MFSRFIGGTNIRAAARRTAGAYYTPIFDYARESSKNEDESWEYIHRLSADLEQFPRGSALALKASSFAGNDMHLMYAIKRAVKNGIRTVFLDAESVSNYEKENTAYDKAVQAFNQNSTICYKTYQMYRKSAIEDLLHDMESCPRLGIKLVRGAYYRQDAPTGALYQNKASTDAAFDTAVRASVAAIRSGAPHSLVIATHNDRSIDRALALEPPRGSTSFAQLLGMNELAGRRIANEGYRVYKYVPYGGLTETYPYLMRRLYENLDVLAHAR